MGYYPDELQDLLDSYTDTVDLHLDNAISHDYVLCVRSEDLDGNETVHTYTSDGLSPVTAVGMLEYSKSDIWAGRDDTLDDDY